MFGIRKSAKNGKKIVAVKPEEVQVNDPFEDEPSIWKNGSDMDWVKNWYDLESLTDNSLSNATTSNPVSFAYYFDEANKGSRCAQYALAKMYLTGTLVEKNTFQAGLWFTQASEQSSPFASYELAKMMYLGLGFGKDPGTALQLYEKAYQSFLQIEERTPNKAVEQKLAVICDNKLCQSADQTMANHWRQLAADFPDSGNEMEDMVSPLNDPMILHTIPVPELNIKPPIPIRTEKSSAGKMEEIPVEYIFPSEDNPYAKLDTDEAVYAMALSIQTNGLVNPLILNMISETEYRIISGEKRYKAITTHLHWKTIPSIVHNHLSKNAAQLMLHTANLEAREYNAAQKLQFYIDTESLLQQMKESGEYSGPVQKGISELLGISTHQVRKYKKIVEGLSRDQLEQVRNGEISIEKAYHLARTVVSEEPDVVERPETGRASAFEEEPDVVERPETGRASAFSEEPDVAERPETGRASAFEGKPDVTEEPETGRASAFSEEPDVAEGPETGRASAYEPQTVVLERVRNRPTLILERGPDTVKEEFFDDPKSYHEAVRLLDQLPIAPGESCAVMIDGSVNVGKLDHIALYKNAMLLFVKVGEIRRSYPVSMIGRSLFFGSDSLQQAEVVRTNSL